MSCNNRPIRRRLLDAAGKRVGTVSDKTQKGLAIIHSNNFGKSFDKYDYLDSWDGRGIEIIEKYPEFHRELIDWASCVKHHFSVHVNKRTEVPKRFAFLAKKYTGNPVQRNARFLFVKMLALKTDSTKVLYRALLAEGCENFGFGDLKTNVLGDGFIEKTNELLNNHTEFPRRYTESFKDVDVLDEACFWIVVNRNVEKIILEDESQGESQLVQNAMELNGALNARYTELNSGDRISSDRSKRLFSLIHETDYADAKKLLEEPVNQPTQETTRANPLSFITKPFTSSSKSTTTPDSSPGSQVQAVHQLTPTQLYEVRTLCDKVLDDAKIAIGKILTNVPLRQAPTLARVSDDREREYEEGGDLTEQYVRQLRALDDDARKLPTRKFESSDDEESWGDVWDRYKKRKDMERQNAAKGDSEKPGRPPIVWSDYKRKLMPNIVPKVEEPKHESNDDEDGRSFM